MEFQLPIRIPSLPRPIRYPDKLMLTGSCFTEHIGNQLGDWKFDILQNPNGILFDPASVAGTLVSYIKNKQYGEADLVYFNELWHSWQHHSIFSGMDKGETLRRINDSQERAHAFLKEADWLIITLGSAFSYRLAAGTVLSGGEETGRNVMRGAGWGSGALTVANCHRAPAQTFDKHLMTIEEINTALDNCIHQLFHFNRKLQIIFTVSPVRHIRDGVIENNRSKGRLIECVHHLVNKFDRIAYFPAYELVIDVLRDYRFYDVDMVHPNYPATAYVLEQFTRNWIDEESQKILAEIRQIVIARRHKPFQPATQAHRRFLEDQLQKARALQASYPFLDLSEELAYFAGQ